MDNLARKSSRKTFEQIAIEVSAHVRKFRRIGATKATFCCPVHEDKNPSAWIEESKEGWTHAHCSVCGNLKDYFREIGIFPTPKEGNYQSAKQREERKSYLETLRARQREFIHNQELPTPVLEMLYSLHSDSNYLFPVEGPEWERRWAALQKQERVLSAETCFGRWNQPEAIEKTRQIALRYLREHRHLTGKLDELYFSRDTLDRKLSRQKLDILTSVGCILITPLRSPAHQHERGWQETWLDYEGRKILRHFPAGVPQAGRFFHAHETGATTLVIGEGMESSLSGTSLARKIIQRDNLSIGRKIDTLAVMSLYQFAHVESKTLSRYTNIILCPDLETHGKGLLAILNLAGRVLPQLPHTTGLHLFRPDGKGVTDPIAEKRDFNDLLQNGSPLDPLSIVPLDLQNILPPDHPMRDWTQQPIDEIQSQYQSDLQDILNRPANGSTEIHALGTGVGKSHAIAQAAANCSESILIAAPTHEGRASLAKNLDPETQEHHSRSEVLADSSTVLADSDTVQADSGSVPQDGANPLKDPQRFCLIYQKQECEEQQPRIRLVIKAEQTPSPALVSDLGFPVSHICNAKCPHGLATLHWVTNGKKGENNGETHCPHMEKRLAEWYQQVRLASTHAAINGDKSLSKRGEQVRSKIVLDEEPEWLESLEITTETLYQARLGLQQNFHYDSKFYVEPDREDVLEDYQKLSAWLAYMDHQLLGGWKDGNLPPMPGHEWSEFHELVQKHHSIAYVTRFERPHTVLSVNGVKRKVYTPVILNWLSESIRMRTAFFANHTLVAYRATEIGKIVQKKRRKQYVIIATATPSRLLRSLGKITHQAYPATPNLEVTWTRGKSWSKTYLEYNRDKAVGEVIDVLEALPPKAVLLTTKAYEEALPEGHDFGDVLIGHWGKDDTGHNRYMDRTHMEILGVQILPRKTYWMEYEAIRRIYKMNWEACPEDVEWVSQFIGIDYLPGSETSCTLPDHADLTWYIREKHTQELAQAIGRFRAARRLDEPLTVNIRCNIPPLPLYGLVIHKVDGHSHRQEAVHNRAVDRVANTVQQALNLGLKPTFAQIDRLAKETTGKGIRYKNWKQVMDTLVTSDDCSSVKIAVPTELLWKLQNHEAIRSLARCEGDKLRRAEAAMPGRGDGPDGEALLDTLALMDRENCDSEKAAARLLSEIAKNRHHPDERYVKMLQEIVMHPIPVRSWLQEPV